MVVAGMKIAPSIQLSCVLAMASGCLSDAAEPAWEAREVVTSNALTSNALTSNALDDPSQGEDAAAIIEYSVRCMLAPDQSVTITFRRPDDTEATETYWGSLGLEPDWADDGLSPAGRRWWGACLGAHVNAFGLPVSISLRGPHAALTLTAEEAENYQIREGAFYAEYVASRETPLHIFSCSDPSNVDAAYAQNRICAHESCGAIFTVVGDCLGPAADACESARADDLLKGDFFRRCHRSAAGPEWPDSAITQVITANLRD
jgi:hypothetical protein